MAYYYIFKTAHHDSLCDAKVAEPSEAVPP